jgi:hypothetical protein
MYTPHIKLIISSRNNIFNTHHVVRPTNTTTTTTTTTTNNDETKKLRTTAMIIKFTLWNHLWTIHDGMVTPGPSVMSNSMDRNTNVNFSSIFCEMVFFFMVRAHTHIIIEADGKETTAKNKNISEQIM